MKQKRIRKVAARLTDEEFKMYQEKLAASGMIQAEFIRLALFNVKVVAKMTIEERQVLRSLVGIATNLNQIAHLANASKNLENLLTEIKSTRYKIDIIIEKYHSI